MNNSTSYFKRYLIVIFIILLLLFFPARSFLRKNGLFIFSEKNLKESLLWAHQDSIRVADSLKRIKIESSPTIDKQVDSPVKSDKEEIPVFSKASGQTYYIITGSFSNHENARAAAEKYHKLGYKTSFISTTNRNTLKIELMSIKSFNNLNEAVRYLEEFRSKFDPAAWIYSKK
jgi:hypothetical protein